MRSLLRRYRNWIILIGLVVGIPFSIFLFLNVIIPGFVVLDGIMSVILDPFKEPPASTLFILALSVAISTLIQGLNRVIVDVDRRKRIMEEVQRYQALVKRAKDSGSKRLALKVERRKRYIDKLNSEVAKMMFRPLLYTMIPFILFFRLLGGVYPPTVYVAYSSIPFNLLLPDFIANGFGVWTEYGFGLYFGFWYILCSFAISTISNKIFGITPPEAVELDVEK